MYLIRRQPHTRQENDPSERDAKVKFESDGRFLLCDFRLLKKSWISGLKIDIKWFFDKQVCELRAALGPLSGRSLQFCTDSCLRRYLEARNWNVDKAKKMLEETIKWRATFKPEEIRWVCGMQWLPAHFLDMMARSNRYFSILDDII